MKQTSILNKIASIMAVLIFSSASILADTNENPIDEISKQTVVKTLEISPKRMKIDDTYIGHLKPIERVIVSADTEGPVEKINFREGQLVKKNQTLLHIATERLAIKKKIARSNYYSSVDSYQKEKKLLDQDFQTQQLKIQIAQAESNFKLSQTNYEKELKMFQKNISTETRIDNAKNTLDHARANMELSRLEYARYSAISDTSKLNNLKNQMDINGYQLELAKLDLNRSKVKSPFSGIVSKKKVEIGGFINKGQELLEIMDISKVLALIKIPENKIRFVKVGSIVQITLDAVPGKTFTGTIKTLGLEADQQSRTFPAEVQINNPKRQLLPGMMARVKMELKSSEKQIMIPRHVVLSRNETKVVFVVESGIAKIRHLTLGKTVKGEVQVLSGLKFGEKLIISGQQYLTHNEKVELKNDTKIKLARR